MFSFVGFGVFMHRGHRFLVGTEGQDDTVRSVTF